MTITKALRKLYKVIVGEEAPANANTITKVLLALAEAWTGGGGSGGSGGGDPGYSCKQEITTVVNAAVTTVKPTDPDPISPYPFGDIPYNKFLNAETIIVKFNGTDYICDRNTIDDSNAYYGADGNQDYDWSEYPFHIQTFINPVDESEGNSLYTENAGVYDIKIDEVKISVDVTPCFAAAVKKVTGIS